MRNALAASLALAGALLADSPALAQRGRGGDREAARNGWLFSLSEGKRQARQSGKPLMVVLRCTP
jgi:hypothetical protein